MSRLWGGRFAGDTAPAMRALSRSTHFDVRLVEQDCRVLAAHAAVLGAAGFLDEAECDAVRAALPAVAADIASGAFPIAPEDEDVHTTVERALGERVPGAAAKVRAGLSRNDRVVTALRLWSMEHAHAVRDELLALVEALADRAAEHAGALMPGYTHLQRAQPVTLGQTLAAHTLAFTRDAERIAAAIARADAMPLGAGALAGSTLPLDHEIARADLGFASTMPSTLDAVAARDFALELLAAFAILGVGLSRLGEEIVLWTSSEFAFAELDDAYATGSSLMPQKKNPDVAELTRGKAGRLVGNLTSLLVACKGLPLAYNRDLQEDKEPLFDAVDTLLLVLPALAGAVSTMRFDTERLRAAAADPALAATALAEHLVAGGVAFRDAHEAVGRAVRLAADTNRSLADLGAAELAAIHPGLAGDLVAVLDPARVTAGRVRVSTQESLRRVRLLLSEQGRAGGAK